LLYASVPKRPKRKFSRTEVPARLPSLARATCTEEKIEKIKLITEC